MSWGTERPRGDPPTSPGTVTVRVARLWVGALAGLAVTVVGAWAAVAVFVGPLFGYRVTSTAAWHWSEVAGILHLAPGAVATIAGLLLLGGSSSSRVVKVPLGLLVVVAGAWLVVGPAAWSWIGHGAVYLHNRKAEEAFLARAGAALGPGLLLVALGTVVAGRPPARLTVAAPPPPNPPPTWASAAQPRHDAAEDESTASYPAVAPAAPPTAPLAIPPPLAPTPPQAAPQARTTTSWEGEPTAPGWGPPA